MRVAKQGNVRIRGGVIGLRDGTCRVAIEIEYVRGDTERYMRPEVFATHQEALGFYLAEVQPMLKEVMKRAEHDGLTVLNLGPSFELCRPEPVD